MIHSPFFLAVDCSFPITTGGIFISQFQRIAGSMKNGFAYRKFAINIFYG